MSKRVWVRWKDSSTGVYLFAKVKGLEEEADVDDLCGLFVQQQFLGVSPGAVQVRETEHGAMLTASTQLTNYFVPPVADSKAAALPGPGNSEVTALFLTVPVKQQTADAHINVSNAVFVLYENTELGPDPIATAFAVSNYLLMTSAHNVVTRPGAEDDGMNNEEMSDAEEKLARDRGQDLCIANLMIARLLHKDGKGHVSVEGVAIPVALAHYHYFHDWAFLKVCNGVQLTTTIPMATTPEELPERGTLEKIYIYHCPVKIFRESRRRTSVHAMPKEASVGTISDKSLSFQNGGFSGSCGGPYVFRNKVVALHVASSNDIVDFEMLDEDMQVGTRRKRKKTLIEKTKEVAESCASSHASLGTGIILQARSGIMKVFRGEIAS